MPSAILMAKKVKKTAKPKTKGRKATRARSKTSGGSHKKPTRGRKGSRFGAKTLRGIREKLEAEREDLQAQLKEIEEAAFNATQSEISGEVGYDEDYADAGSATFEREKDLSIHNNVLDLLERVERAVKKIDDKTYGICESCGNPIEAARLKALPSTVLCLECKKREERR
jgi:DnaK suppressor protein